MAMQRPEDYLLALCTCPDEATARRLASLLVEDHLAACVNILPGLTSVYRWQGRTESASEWLLLIKTHRSRYPSLEQQLREHHPYELPEIVAVSISNGLPDYLRWISEAVGIE